MLESSSPIREAVLFADQGEIKAFHLPKHVLDSMEEDRTAWDHYNDATYADGEAVAAEAQEATPELMREIRAELAFIGIEDGLKEDVARLEPELSGHKDRDVQEEIMAREKSFFTKVFAAGLEMAEKQPGPVTLLFDIDLTTTHANLAVARPALGLVIRELDDALGDRLRIGLVSSRPGESLKSELYNPTYTSGFNHRLDPEVLISSGDLYRSDPSARDLIDGKDTAAQIEAVKDVLDPEIIEDVRAGRTDIRDFLLQDPKLFVLQEMLAKYPDGAFVLFDDLPQAAAVSRDSSRVKGVRLNEEILDRTLLPYSQLQQPASPEDPKLLAA